MDADDFTCADLGSFVCLLVSDQQFCFEVVGDQLSLLRSYCSMVSTVCCPGDDIYATYVA